MNLEGEVRNQNRKKENYAICQERKLPPEACSSVREDFFQCWAVSSHSKSQCKIHFGF